MLPLEIYTQDRLTHTQQHQSSPHSLLSESHGKRAGSILS